MDILELVHDDERITARPHACEFEGCVKAFARRSDLVRHHRIHTNTRPYACTHEDCGKTFIQKSALIVHERVHTGERPHHCEWEECGKAFSDSSSLARHRRIHTGNRPYRCQIVGCNKSFCRKTTLTKHVKKHHPYASYPSTPTSSTRRSSLQDSSPSSAYGPATPQDMSMDSFGTFAAALPSPKSAYYRSVSPAGVNERSSSVLSTSSVLSAPTVMETRETLVGNGPVFQPYAMSQYLPPPPNSYAFDQPTFNLPSPSYHRVHFNASIQGNYLAPSMVFTTPPTPRFFVPADKQGEECHHHYRYEDMSKAYANHTLKTPTANYFPTHVYHQAPMTVVNEEVGPKTLLAPPSQFKKSAKKE